MADQNIIEDQFTDDIDIKFSEVSLRSKNVVLNESTTQNIKARNRRIQGTYKVLKFIKPKSILLIS